MKWAHVDWCTVTDDAKALQCRRCGRTEPLTLPADLQAVVLRMQAFCVDHAHCSAKVPAGDRQL